MEGQDIRGLMEAYSQVYETPEVLNEEVEDLHEVPNPARDAAQAKAYAADQQRISKLPTSGKGVFGNVKVQTRDRSGQASGYRQYYKSSSDGKMYANYNDAAAARQSRLNTLSKAQSDIKKAAPGIILPGDPRLKKPAAPAAPTKPGSNTPAPTRPGSNAPAPARPSAAPAKPTNTQKPTTPTAPQKPAGSAMDQWRAANPKLANKVNPDGTQKGTGQSQMSRQAAELRDMQKASQMRQKGADVMGSNITSVRQDLEKANKPENLNKPAPAGTALAKQQAMTAIKKPSADLKFEHLDVFDIVKGHLLDEGYAETEENALVIMANMSEEWRQSIINEISKELATKAFATRARDAFEMDDNKQHDKADKTKERIVKKHGKEAGDEAEKAAERSIYGHNKYSEAQEREEEKKKSMKKEEVEINEKMEKWIQKAIKKPGALSKQLGVPEEENIPMSKLKAAAKKGGTLGKRANLAMTLKGLHKEDLEAWVDELIAEGYDLSGYTWEEVAEIYAQELELSEAQRARENPEDHDKEEKRKYEPVRGEKTPMPPRGDKRREEFEKWYAKHVR